MFRVMFRALVSPQLWDIIFRIVCVLVLAFSFCGDKPIGIYYGNWFTPGDTKGPPLQWWAPGVEPNWQLVILSGFGLMKIRTNELIQAIRTSSH